MVDDDDDGDGGIEPETWLVDGFNVLHVGILRGRTRGRWWQREPRAQVLIRARRFDGPGRIRVVFDGPDPDGPDAGGGATGPDEPEDGGSASVEVVFAESADEWLLRAVREAPEPGAVAVVTGDRRLADRARHRGARIVAPRAFLARCKP